MQVTPQNYRMSIDNKGTQVAPAKAEVAKQIDVDGDGNLSTREINDYIDKLADAGLHGCGHHHNSEFDLDSDDVNVDRAREFSFSLAEVPNPDRAGYHSFDQAIAEMDKLAEANPEFVQRNILGKTAEGRDIVAYKLSEGAQGDTSNKTGIVITGCHHAREWATVEAPLKLAHDLLDGLSEDPAKQTRLKDSEIWIVPCVNPDGYEYSRSRDNMWRKNRRPLEVDQLGNPTKAVGVDLNRNYWDMKPEHEHIYRPDGDKPGDTGDDFSATSDNPRSEVYRGPSGGSEVETKAMIDLQINRPNIKGCIDYHSYGNDIFYPWDHTAEPGPNLDLYKQLQPKLEDATGGWTVSQGSDLYLNAGDSTDTQGANGILGLTFEMGKSFQPRPSQLPEITGKASAATQVFIDEIINMDKAGLIQRGSINVG